MNGVRQVKRYRRPELSKHEFPGVKVFVAVAVAGFVSSGLAAGSEPVVVLTPDDETVVAEGAVIYEQQCAECHGADLEGQPNWRMRGNDGLLPAPPHDETGHTWHHTDDVLFGITKYGAAAFSGLAARKTNMPVYEDVLTDAEILAVLSYIKAQWPEDLKERHDEMNAMNTRSQRK